MQEPTYEMKNGLRLSTEEDKAMLRECNASALSLSTLWENRDDEIKILSWDQGWEDYLDRRAKLIDADGRVNYLPWNAYKKLNMDWLDGYAFIQNTGDCVSFGHRNALKASNLSNGIRTGRKPREIAHSMTFAIARGSYNHPNFGSGANLTPMAKAAAQYGNYWTADFGQYDTGRYCGKFRQGGVQDEHAKQTQSIICFLPANTFDNCFRACYAGFGIVIGTSIFPGGSSVNEDGLAVCDRWDSGAHCTSLVAGWIGDSGKKYVYLENSHPTRYANDDLNSGHQWGCWLSEAEFRRMVRGAEDYGGWYVNIGELG